MSVQIELGVAQLLCSRLCHDLIGPLGAVNAGLELMEDQSLGGGVAGEAMDLLKNSARQAASRLAFYRMAFGSGSGGGGATPLEEARILTVDLLADRKVDLDWPENIVLPPNASISPTGAKLLLNLVLLALEMVPRTGVIQVRFASLPEGVGAALTATGPGARIKDEIRTAMEPGAERVALSAHNVQAHFARCLADFCGSGLEVAVGAEDEVKLAAILPCA